MPRPSLLIRTAACGAFSAGLTLHAGCGSVPTAAAAPTSSAEPPVYADTVTLDNGRVRIGLSPKVGRVVDFGALGGDNLIWMADASAYDNPTPGVNGQQYLNLGGDKLWPATQDVWKAATGNDHWPPDGVIDGAPWELTEQTDRAVTIRSRHSDAYGLHVTRRFVLADDAPAVRITNVLHRTTANATPATAWTVTQLRPARYAVMDVAADRPTGLPAYVPLNDSTPEKTRGRVQQHGDTGSVFWEQVGDSDAKLGGHGRWVAAVYDDVTLLQTAPYDPTGDYPARSSVQLYRGDGYVELEMLSPSTELAAGQTLTHVVEWELLAVPARDAADLLLHRDPD